MSELAAAPTEKESEASATKFSPRKRADFLESSTLLHSQGKIAIIPKRCIIIHPEKFKNRIIDTTRNKELVSWKKFYAQNRAWIHVHEVTFDQAAGLEKIAPETLQRLYKMNKVVIAKHGKGLITVSPKALTQHSEE